MRIRAAHFVAVLSMALGVGACGAAGPTSDVQPVFFPPPPDTARIQFLTRFSGAKDFGGSGRSFLDRITGEREEQPEIRKPYGIGVGPGRIYVCDIRLPGIDVIDLAAQTFEVFQPTGEGSLHNPVSCAVDPADGRLFVADPDRRQVVVFSRELQYLAAFGDGEGIEPLDVEVHENLVWVTDIGQGKVRAYDRATYAPVLEFPDVEPADSAWLRQPVSIAVSEGEVFVSDGLQFTVKVYDTEGNLRRTIGRLGRGPGQFSRQKGIALDRSGYLYVVDASFQNVQIFSREGSVLTFFGGPYRGPGYLYMPATVAVDYANLEYFQRYVDQRFTLKHLIFVTNQFGPDKVTVYGFVEPKEGARDGP
jgi:hypothetical protein